VYNLVKECQKLDVPNLKWYMVCTQNIILCCFDSYEILLLETTASRALRPLDLLTVPSMRSKHCESIEPESHQMAKMDFILLFHSKLRDSLTIDFT